MVSENTIMVPLDTVLLRYNIKLLFYQGVQRAR